MKYLHYLISPKFHSQETWDKVLVDGYETDGKPKNTLANLQAVMARPDLQKEMKEFQSSVHQIIAQGLKAGKLAPDTRCQLTPTYLEFEDQEGSRRNMGVNVELDADFVTMEMILSDPVLFDYARDEIEEILGNEGDPRFSLRAQEGRNLRATELRERAASFRQQAKELEEQAQALEQPVEVDGPGM